MALRLSGTVQDDGSAVARKVRAYLRSSGALAGETTSDAGTGAWHIDVASAAPHTVVCLDADAGDRNALVLDRVEPVLTVIPAAWDPATVASPLVLSLSNTRLSLPTGNTTIARTARATRGVTGGKWYWEVGVVSVIDGNGTTTGVGFCDSSHASATQNLAGGTNGNSVGYWCSGAVFRNGVNIASAAPYNDGDTLMFAVDFDAGNLWIGRNGTWVSPGNPAAGTGALVMSLNSALTYFPAATPWSSGADTVGLDIRTLPVYTPPSGFQAYNGG